MAVMLAVTSVCNVDAEIHGQLVGRQTHARKERVVPVAGVRDLKKPTPRNTRVQPSREVAPAATNCSEAASLKQCCCGDAGSQKNI
jgi:hypothetical protein